MKSGGTLFIEVALQPWDGHTCRVGLWRMGQGRGCRSPLDKGSTAMGVYERLDCAGALVQGVAQGAAAAIAGLDDVAEGNGSPASSAQMARHRKRWS